MKPTSPTPWRAHEGKYIVDGEGRVVAIMKQIPDDQVRETNARLIAAAPALFEALTDCLLMMNETPQIAMDALDQATGVKS